MFEDHDFTFHKEQNPDDTDILILAELDSKTSQTPKLEARLFFMPSGPKLPSDLGRRERSDEALWWWLLTCARKSMLPVE